MWIYAQDSGLIVAKDNTAIVTGYAGRERGKNAPAQQTIRGLGPLPRGRYALTELIETTATHGPYVIKLTPHPRNEMFGRGGFLIHGDSVTAPGTASKGCIILARAVRERIWTSDDHQLLVVEWW